MKFINTKVVIDMDSGTVLEKIGFWEDGSIELACGPSGGEQAAGNAMKQTSQEQNQAYQQAMSQAQSIFGSSSQIFNQLTSAFSPILAAGPGQSGYTAGELQNLNS